LASLAGEGTIEARHRTVVGGNDLVDVRVICKIYFGMKPMQQCVLGGEVQIGKLI